MFFHRSQHTAKILLVMCVWTIFPLTTDQFPVPGGFSFLLYPVSVPGPYGPHTLLMPVTATDRNTHIHTPQANSSKLTSQSLSKPSNANSGFLQPEPGRDPVPNIAPGSALSPAPDLHALPSESSVLQGQMSNFLPSNVPLQVYSFVQQAVIADSGSSEEGNTAQVVYMIPVHVESPSMGVMEGGSAPAPDPAPVPAPIPAPDPGHLHVPLTTSASASAVRPDAHGPQGKTDALGEKPL